MSHCKHTTQSIANCSHTPLLMSDNTRKSLSYETHKPQRWNVYRRFLLCVTACIFLWQCKVKALMCMANCSRGMCSSSMFHTVEHKKLRYWNSCLCAGLVLRIECTSKREGLVKHLSLCHFCCMCQMHCILISFVFTCFFRVVSSNVSITYLPCVYAVRSGKADSSLSFSLQVLTRPLTATPSSSRRFLYCCARSASLRTEETFCSIRKSSINAPSSTKTIPWS